MHFVRTRHVQRERSGVQLVSRRNTKLALSRRVRRLHRRDGGSRFYTRTATRVAKAKEEGYAHPTIPVVQRCVG